jgi:hypothetical protein
MPRNFLKKLAAIFLISFCLTGATVALSAPSALAQGESYDFNRDSGLTKAGDTAGYETGADRTSVEDIISNVIYAVLGLVGIIFFGFIIYGGLIWMTAQGNEEKIKKATDIVMNSLFGLIITLAAYGIAYFLISYFWQ